MLRKFVSVLLVVGILFCCVPISVAELATDVVPTWLAELVGEHSYQSRLLEFESSTNIIGFLRSDGAKTVYIFNRNIRELDESRIADENILLTTTENSIPDVGMADAFVSSARPTASFGNQTVSYIGSHDVYDTCRMFVKFDGLSSLEIDYNKVLSAYYHITDNNSSTRSAIEAYYITED